METLIRFSGMLQDSDARRNIGDDLFEKKYRKKTVDWLLGP